MPSLSRLFSLRLSLSLSHTPWQTLGAKCLRARWLCLCVLACVRACVFMRALACAWEFVRVPKPETLNPGIPLVWKGWRRKGQCTLRRSASRGVSEHERACVRVSISRVIRASLRACTRSLLRKFACLHAKATRASERERERERARAHARTRARKRERDGPHGAALAVLWWIHARRDAEQVTFENFILHALEKAQRLTKHRSRHGHRAHRPRASRQCHRLSGCEARCERSERSRVARHGPCGQGGRGGRRRHRVQGGQQQERTRRDAIRGHLRSTFRPLT